MIPCCKYVNNVYIMFAPDDLWIGLDTYTNCILPFPGTACPIQEIASINLIQNV